MGEPDHLAVLGREALERRCYLPAEQRALDRLLADALVELARLDREGRAHGAAALQVDDRVARDPVEPGAEAGARVVVGVRVAPDAREDVLDELLGEPAVAEGIEGEPVELAGVGSVQGTHRVLALFLLEAFQQGC